MIKMINPKQNPESLNPYVVSLTLPPELFNKLMKISEDKKVVLEELVKQDLANLVMYYRELYESIGLIL